jgi:hypothetical protein
MNEFKKNRSKDRKNPGLHLCIWSKAGAVSVRTCIRELDCRRCLFDQNMTDYFAGALRETPAVPQAA